MTNFYHRCQGNKLFYGWHSTNQHYVEDFGLTKRIEPDTIVGLLVSSGKGNEEPGTHKVPGFSHIDA